MIGNQLRKLRLTHKFHIQFSLSFSMVDKRFFHWLDSFEFEAAKSTFLGSIWWLIKFLQVLGLTPVQISATESSIDLIESKGLLAYNLILFILNAVFVIQSHVNMQRDHLKHLSPVIFRVAYSQLILHAVTAFIGIMNILLMRKKMIMVNNWASYFNIIVMNFVNFSSSQASIN